MHKKMQDLEQGYQQIMFSMNTYGDKPELPDTYVEYAKTKGIVTPAMKK